MLCQRAVENQETAKRIINSVGLQFAFCKFHLSVMSALDNAKSIARLIFMAVEFAVWITTSCPLDAANRRDRKSAKFGSQSIDSKVCRALKVYWIRPAACEGAQRTNLKPVRIC